MNKRDDVNYYLGFDVGTNSVGWAVTDENYNLLRKKGKIYGEFGCLMKQIQQQKEERFVR